MDKVLSMQYRVHYFLMLMGLKKVAYESFIRLFLKFKLQSYKEWCLNLLTFFSNIFLLIATCDLFVQDNC